MPCARLLRKYTPRRNWDQSLTEVEWDEEHGGDEVRAGKADDEHVGKVLHRLDARDYKHDHEITEDPQDRDQTVAQAEPDL